MSVQPFVLRPYQHGRALNVVGTQVTMLASNAATQSRGITLRQSEEGTGPPPHRHDWDEAFYGLVVATHGNYNGNGISLSIVLARYTEGNEAYLVLVRIGLDSVMLHENRRSIQ